MPLLSQGWALLSAHQVQLAGCLEASRQNLVSSVWTLFDGDGTKRIEAGLRGGEIT
jgi:hypothetical protein